MIAEVQRNPYKMGKLRAVLEKHLILLGFANAGDYLSCSLELRNAFFVFTLCAKTKSEIQLISQNRIRVLQLKEHCPTLKLM
jgi:hypothetical protein